MIHWQLTSKGTSRNCVVCSRVMAMLVDLREIGDKSNRQKISRTCYSSSSETDTDLNWNTSLQFNISTHRTDHAILQFVVVNFQQQIALHRLQIVGRRESLKQSTNLTDSLSVSESPRSTMYYTLLSCHVVFWIKSIFTVKNVESNKRSFYFRV